MATAIRSGRIRGWHVYVILLAASQLFLGFRTLPPERIPGIHYQVLQCQTEEGPVAGTVRLAYREQGSGEAVIYLHGSPGSGRDADRLAPLLARRFRVLSPDLPGFGASSRWIPDYGIRAHARYVLAFMDALGIPRAHLIGHSMGSGVAFEMAQLAPSRVASITAYGGIGVQEGEGSGDYYFEHLKYGVGYLALVVLPELVPHFGLLGSRAGRHAFIRNFWDTDQRPLRAVLEGMKTPLLILQGRDDPLVPAETAEKHHSIVSHSELVMLDASHFLVFSSTGSRRLAAEILPFLERSGDSATPPRRRTVDYSRGPKRRGILASRLRGLSPLGPWVQCALLALLCFPLGHLACLGSGLLARGLVLDPFVAAAGCYLGIVASDVALFLLGRSLRRHPDGALAARVGRAGRVVAGKAGRTVLLSRCVPGLRLISHPGLGWAGVRPSRFLLACMTTAVGSTMLVVGLGIAFDPSIESLVGWL